MSIMIGDGYVALIEEKRVIDHGAVYVENGRISAVGKSDEITSKHRAEIEIDAKGKIVLPGLINSHDHEDSGTFIRTLYPDADLLEWLRKFKWPLVENMNAEDHYWAGLSCYLENVKGGVTLAANNFYGVRGMELDGIARAAEEIGIRSVLARGYHDDPLGIPDSFVEPDIERLKDEYSHFFDKWHNKADERLKVWVAPINLTQCTPESIKTLNELAGKHGSGIHTHVAESRKATQMIRERFGKGWVEVLNDLGVVGPRFQGAHCVWIEEKEMDILAKMKATIVHNPSSNMILSSGIAPVARMLNHGVRVALGSDSCRDLISAMGLASGLQKVSTLDPMALKAWDVLRMATLNGAEAFGMEDEIGSLRPGKKADITVVNLRAPHIAPIRDPVTALVYFAHSSDVDTVIVDGKIVLDNRVVKTVDEDAVLEKVQAHASEAATRAGLPA